MATKKQKRERAEAARKQYMAAVRKDGLKAQKADREHRDRKNRDGWKEKHNKSHSPKTADPACPFCQDHTIRQNHKQAKARKN